MKWIDLSLPIATGMPVFPGDPEVITEYVLTHEKDGLQLSLLKMGSHTGTHLDAPRHFIASGESVSDLTLDRFCGPALVLSCPVGPGEKIDLTQLDFSALKTGDALLLSTGWEDHWGTEDYFSAAPLFAEGSSTLLLRLGVRLLGLDLPTVSEAAEPSQPAAMHIRLLEAGVILVENLTNLKDLAMQRVEFFALPLRLDGCDGSPIRACCRISPPLSGSSD